MTRCLTICHTPTPSQCHCGTCHRTFGGASGFDRHRRGGLCLDPAGLGYELVKGVWRQPMNADQLARLIDATTTASERKARQ